MADLDDNDQPVKMAKQALANSLGISANQIKFGTARKERLPNEPGMAAQYVRYRYFIFLEYGDAVYQYRFENGKVYFLAQA